MKVAILGVGICGLSCALELERNGIVPVIFERDAVPGWVWPSVTFAPYVFYNVYGDPRKQLLKEYKVDICPIGMINSVTMKSPNNKVRIEGTLGYISARGNLARSLENQLYYQLTSTAIHFTSKEDYENLSKKYDYVVVTTGKDSEARKLGVWEDEGIVYIIESYVNGSFDPGAAEIYFNTDYAGTGYGRVTPFNYSTAVVGLYLIGKGEMDALQCYRDFIRRENLDKNEFVIKALPAPFTTGRVKKFRIDNILLAGRAAGLTERVLGCGGYEAFASGTLAARSIINGEDYDKMVKPLQKHVENISAYRKLINKFTNDDFDKMVGAIEFPGVRQIIYNTGIGITGIVGNVLKLLQK